MNGGAPGSPTDWITFPIVVLDFEASALTMESFQIEVGLAIARSPTHPIETWSSLIQPAGHWDFAAQWDPDAERLHGISRRQLRDGMPCVAVMAKVNALVPANITVWCDGGSYDAQWLAELEAAAGQSADFTLADLGAVIRASGPAHARFLEIMRRTKPPHRAGPDAARLCAALQELALPTSAP